jgi:hypothetical protein
MNKIFIRTLIAKGNLKEALEGMLQMAADTRCQNDVLLLSARFREMEQHQMRGTQSTTELNLSRNQITHAMLELLEELPDEANAPLQKHNHAIGKTRAGLSIKNILFAIAALLALAAIWFIVAWLKAEPDNKEPLPALLSAISTLILLVVAWRYEGGDAGQTGGFTLFRSNKATIRGKNIQVHQGNKGNITIEINRLDADGEGHRIDQG